MTLSALIAELETLVQQLAGDPAVVARCATIADELRQRVADADQMAEREPVLWAAIERLDGRLTENDDSRLATDLRLVLDSLEQGAVLTAGGPS